MILFCVKKQTKTICLTSLHEFSWNCSHKINSKKIYQVLILQKILVINSSKFFIFFKIFSLMFLCSFTPILLQHDTEITFCAGAVIFLSQFEQKVQICFKNSSLFYFSANYYYEKNEYRHQYEKIIYLFHFLLFSTLECIASGPHCSLRVGDKCTRIVCSTFYTSMTITFEIPE